MKNTLSNRRLAVAMAAMALLGVVGPFAFAPSAPAASIDAAVQSEPWGVFLGEGQGSCARPETLGEQEKDVYTNWKDWTPIGSDIGSLDRSEQPWAGQPSTLCMDIGGSWC